MPPGNDGIAKLTELLHDATLKRGSWDGPDGHLTLRFECLRRAADGGKLDDPIVDLALSGVVAIAMSYDPSSPEERPSAFRAPDSAVIAELSPWPLPAGEVDAVVDSNDACDDVDLAARTDWLVGDLSRLVDARHRLVLRADARAGQRA